MPQNKDDIIEKKEIKKDARGGLVELFKFPESGQVIYSTTRPGEIRGNHYHTRKVEKFCVVEGEGMIRIRNRETGKIQEIPVSGEHPCMVNMIPHHTHHIENTGKTEMKLIVWANELYNPDDHDTFPETV